MNEEREKGYYKVKHYNHSKIMIMYWNGESFETFKSDPTPPDEIDPKSIIKVNLDLKEKVTHCCLGKDHPCMLNVNDGYCKAIGCLYKVQEIS